MTHYRLVACTFHDELEALATLRQDCDILYRNSEDEIQKVTGKIIDVYAKNHADYLKLQDGMVIRLDSLISVNGKPIHFATSPFSCS